MTDDGDIERLVKAKWLAIGLSQSDLAEVLDAALAQANDDSGSNEMDAASMGRIADALAVPLDQNSGAPDVLLGLRLLRAFNEIRDARAKRLLVHLAEQIVKRPPSGRSG
jgi:hypothetical protein